MDIKSLSLPGLTIDNSGRNCRRGNVSLMPVKSLDKSAQEVQPQVRTVYRIRKARTADWPDILRLQSLNNRPARRDSIVSDYFVAFVSDELVGSCAIRANADAGYLYGLVVSRQWRKRGIGHALTSECLGHLQSSQVRKVLALAMFWNIRFFRKHGFSVIKRTSLPNDAAIHHDFSEDWSRRSTLLCVDFSTHCSKPTGTGS